MSAMETGAGLRAGATTTAGDEPRCPTCGEPERLLACGTVGHGGDEYGYDCVPVPLDGCACEDCEALRSGAAHRQVGGWGGIPGECGAECACGTTYDGFDDVASAFAMLDSHIAAESKQDIDTDVDGEEPCATCGESLALIAAGAVGHGDGRCIARAGYVAGLRALADVLEQHPELELPYTGRGGSINVILNGDDDQREQVAAWARAMSGVKNKSISRNGDDFYLDGHVAGLPVCVIAERDEVCTRVVVGTREVTEEIPDPDVFAAVPKTTVTKIVEDVDWVCHPILDDARVGAS